MKLHADQPDAFSITGYGAGWVSLNGRKHTQSLWLSSQGQLQDWPCTHFDQLGPAHFETLAETGAELVVFGSGQRLRFPKPQWLQALIRQGMGLEAMDSAAACRTYNILAGEGRHVVLALIIEADTPA